jgi:hypothetical protein
MKNAFNHENDSKTLFDIFLLVVEIKFKMWSNKYFTNCV